MGVCLSDRWWLGPTPIPRSQVIIEHKTPRRYSKMQRFYTWALDLLSRAKAV